MRQVIVEVIEAKMTDHLPKAISGCPKHGHNSGVDLNSDSTLDSGQKRENFVSKGRC
jgi:hypothetical protein